MTKRYLRLLAWLAITALPSAALAQPVGPEFQVNSYTTSQQWFPAVASDAVGNFVVVWSSDGQDGSYEGVFGRRYDRNGNPLGSEFHVNSYTTSYQRYPSIASDAVGNFVVVWDGFYQYLSSYGIFGQRYDSSGNALGAEFQVNTATFDGSRPSIASDAVGNFVVVWNSFFQDGGGFGIEGQRYDSGGNALGDEFQVNTYVYEDQASPSVALDASGNFVVVWQSLFQAGSNFGIFGQRFKGAANPLGCDDLRAVRVRCHNGDLQVAFALVDDSHDGHTLTLRVNGHDRVLPIEGNRAKTSGPGQGLNRLLLVDPPDCKEEKSVQCP